MGIFDTRSGFSQSFHELLLEARRYVDSFPQKLHKMQEIYLERNPTLYSADEVEQLQNYLKSVSHKFYLATLSLEQLWAIGDAQRLTVLDTIKNGLDRIDCSDDEWLLSSFALEGFLFQSRAFVDFYMLYLSLFLHTGHSGSMSRDTFARCLTRVRDKRFLTKANWIAGYFDSRVFREYDPKLFPRNDWGSLLKSLRDKIAHRDIIRQTLNSTETLVGDVLFNWPTLQGMTYDRFCQDMQNGMFFLLTDISPVIYELEWKPGPYKPGLWE